MNNIYRTGATSRLGAAKTRVVKDASGATIVLRSEQLSKGEPPAWAALTDVDTRACSMLCFADLVRFVDGSCPYLDICCTCTQ